MFNAQTVIVIELHRNDLLKQAENWRMAHPKDKTRPKQRPFRGKRGGNR